MANRKSGAAKPGRTDLVVGRDINPEGATGTSSALLQNVLINEVAQTLPVPGGLGADQGIARVKAAIAALEGIGPRGEIEGMLAAQMVATHNAAMDCFRRAMLPNQTLPGRDQNLKHAAKLLSIYTQQMEALNRNRGKGQQKVTVEYVNVEAGGQAVVGNVETGGSPRRQDRRPDQTASAPTHAPGVPTNSPSAAPAASVEPDKEED